MSVRKCWRVIGETCQVWGDRGDRWDFYCHHHSTIISNIHIQVHCKIKIILYKKKCYIKALHAHSLLFNPIFREILHYLCIFWGHLKLSIKTSSKIGKKKKKRNKEHLIHYHAAQTNTTQIVDETKLLFKRMAYFCFPP